MERFVVALPLVRFRTEEAAAAFGEAFAELVAEHLENEQAFDCLVDSEARTYSQPTDQVATSLVVGRPGLHPLVDPTVKLAAEWRFAYRLGEGLLTEEAKERLVANTAEAWALVEEARF